MTLDIFLELDNKNNYQCFAFHDDKKSLEGKSTELRPFDAITVKVKCKRAFLIFTANRVKVSLIFT
jgi:hypothetical protein